MREVMKGMTVKEIVLDFLHIAWYIAWRSCVAIIVFLGLMYLGSWDWWL